MNERCELRIRRNKIRRKKQLFRRTVFSIFTLLLILTIALGFNSFKVKAETKDTKHLIKYYKSVIVSSNDTLWNYADQYAINDNNKYINELKRINHLETDEIYVGMNLIVPYYSEEFIQ